MRNGTCPVADLGIWKGFMRAIASQRLGAGSDVDVAKRRASRRGGCCPPCSSWKWPTTSREKSDRLQASCAVPQRITVYQLSWIELSTIPMPLFGGRSELSNRFCIFLHYSSTSPTVKVETSHQVRFRCFCLVGFFLSLPTQVLSAPRSYVENDGSLWPARSVSQCPSCPAPRRL